MTTPMITTPQLLAFLVKAQQLNIPCEFISTDDGYCLSLTNKWYIDPLKKGSVNAYEMCVYLKIEGDSLLFQDGYVEYQYMNDYMNEMLENKGTEMITAPQILEFLCKAQQLNMHPNLKQVDNGHVIELHYDWNGVNDRDIRTVFISNQGTSNWEDYDVEFEFMDDYMDKELDKLKAKNELIARLTDEEKELLGLK